MALQRADALRRLATEEFDVLVVGGGITGLGTALDAVSRGLRTALVERDDFSSGTSSKSSKLSHGGLRYLQQGDVQLVYEALHERQRMLRNAPHLVQPMAFMIPLQAKGGVVPRRIARAFGSALWMYDLTGGWRIGRLHRRIGREAARDHFPTAPEGRIAGAYLYYDATVDDSRLCVAVARTAAARGAAVANRARVAQILHDGNGRARGARVETPDAGEFEVRARTVVNASGVWSDAVRATDEGRDPRSIRPAKGIHVTFPWSKVRNDVAIIVPVRQDKRSLFVVPWIPNGDGTYRYTYVGTTDTDFAGGSDESQCSRDDIDYVLRAMNDALAEPLDRSDVTAVWSGLRPLVRSDDASGKTADLSRRHKVAVSESGVVTISGGKLTTYRKMAEHAVDAVADRLGIRARSRTRRLPLVGADGFDRRELAGPDGHLAGRFGSERIRIADLVRERPDLGEPLVPGLPYLRAEAVFAVREEMAMSLDDVLSRRTRCRLLDRRGSVAAARSVAELLAGELGWPPERIDAEVREFTDSCAREDAAAEVSEAAFLAAHGQD
jgi:glycerol-3-phosphate dehydrogenase